MPVGTLQWQMKSKVEHCCGCVIQVDDCGAAFIFRATPPLPNLPLVLPHPLNLTQANPIPNSHHPTLPTLSQSQLRGGNHYLEQSACLPEHIFISSDSQSML